MPLIKSASRSAVGENIRREQDAGRPHRQAIAIALDVQRRARAGKYAPGGPVVGELPPPQEIPSNPWDSVPRSPEGIPQITVTPWRPRAKDDSQIAAQPAPLPQETVNKAIAGEATDWYRKNFTPPTPPDLTPEDATKKVPPNQWDLMQAAPAIADIATLPIPAGKAAAATAAVTKAGLSLFGLRGAKVTEQAFLDTAKFTPIGKQLGTMPGGMFLDPKTQTQWYLKQAPSIEQARNELLGAKLYELGGFPVADVKLTEINGQPGIASKIIPGEQLSKVKIPYDQIKQLHETFPAHAWLKNWDAVGTGPENPLGNIIVDRNGVAHTIDTGGSLLYKGTGTPKPGGLGPMVPELATLKNPEYGQLSASVFGNVSDDVAKVGAQKIANIDEKQIAKLVEMYGPADPKAKQALLSDLLIRKKAIQDWYKVQPKSLEDMVADLVKDMQAGKKKIPSRPETKTYTEMSDDELDSLVKQMEEAQSKPSPLETPAKTVSGPLKIAGYTSQNEIMSIGHQYNTKELPVNEADKLYEHLSGTSSKSIAEYIAQNNLPDQQMQNLLSHLPKYKQEDVLLSVATGSFKNVADKAAMAAKNQNLTQLKFDTYQERMQKLLKQAAIYNQEYQKLYGNKSIQDALILREKNRLAGGYEKRSYRGYDLKRSEDFKTLIPGTNTHMVADWKQPTILKTHPDKWVFSTPSIELAHAYAYMMDDLSHFKPQKNWQWNEDYLRKIEGAILQPLWLNTSKYFKFNANGAIWSEAQSNALGAMAGSRFENAPGIILKNVHDTPSDTFGYKLKHGKPKTVIMTKDEGTMRSSSALFDPKNFGKPGLFKSIGGFGLVGPGAALLIVPDSQAKAQERPMKHGGALDKAMSIGRKLARGGPGSAPWNTRRSSHPQGMIKSSIPGRTDKIPMDVPPGSYILPADIPSALGQGNTMAGEKILGSMFNIGPYGSGATGGIKPARPLAHYGPRINTRAPRISKFAEGGETDEAVPIIAAGGEYVIHPETVTEIGHGNMEAGHKVLDKFVLTVRKNHIGTLKGLKPPKGS